MVNKAVTHIRFHSQRKKLPPIYDQLTEWYQGWYFDLRVEEELSRAKRYGLALSVAAIYLQTSLNLKEEACLRTMQFVRSKQLRRSDIPAIRDERQLAICLTHTNSQQALVVVQRLQKVLADYGPAIGLATFPDDGEDPGRLTATSEHRALSAALPLDFEALARRRRRKPA